MPRPTDAQLRKINQFAHSELEADQVYVFESLCADTLPVARYGWFGEYSINMTKKFLQGLKKDYQKGTGLLASHNNNRLPFGRTFDAHVRADEVEGENVDTLYVDHYIVTHMKDEDGNRREMQTEIGGMTNQNIVDHIEAGHTFDTSIGFSMDTIECTVCGNDLRDWEQCEHLPGLTYDVDGEQVRCNIRAVDGEGLENSLVYAGAVDRALIQNKKAENGGELSRNNSLQSDVNFDDSPLYTVDELKNIPRDAAVFCRFSKGNLTLFTETNERRDYKQYQSQKEDESMPGTNPEVATANAGVSQEAYDKVVADMAALKVDYDTTTAELSKVQGELDTANTELATATDRIAELEPQATLAEKFTKELIEETLNAGVAARGNAFNKERFQKYLETLSVDEVKEELSALKEEFPGSVEAAQVTAKTEELSSDNSEGEADKPMTKQELRNEASTQALARYKSEGKDLAELTTEIYNELLSKQSAK